MRIVLMYPPPWKIPSSGEDPDRSGDGPPADWRPHYRLSGDIVHIPYGLLSLAAQGMRAGHDVTVLNLYTFAWRDVCEIIRRLSAGLYGLSCFTSNRRGVLATARLIREIHPEAHIAVGGPHASALPCEMLEHCAAINTIIIGEGEETFFELVARLERGQPIPGIPGTACRSRQGIETAAPRKRSTDLDSLAAPCDYFDDYIVLTSRGCQCACTFCASSFIWGKKARFHSAGYVLDMLEKMVNIQGHKALAFKDDTFTGNRTRALAICEGIVRRRLNFLWSCDTRSDALDEEVLYAMRAAGCQRISLGVESAAPEILRRLNKRTTPDEVRAATGMAKKFGFQIRYYLIAGSRGETAETLRASIDFIHEAKPSQYIFNPFTLFPGTKEFSIAERRGRANRELFFSGDFFEMTALDEHAERPGLREMIDSLRSQPGIRHEWDYSVSACQTILELFPEIPAVYMDLGGAFYREGNLSEAATYIQKAISRGYPLPGLGYNYLACIAASRGDLTGALTYLIQARECGLHQVVETNLASAREWLQAGGPQSGAQLKLIAGHDFEITCLVAQPVTPGPVTIPDPSGVPVVYTSCSSVGTGTTAEG